MLLQSTLADAEKNRHWLEREVQASSNMCMDIFFVQLKELILALQASLEEKIRHLQEERDAQIHKEVGILKEFFDAF